MSWDTARCKPSDGNDLHLPVVPSGNSVMHTLVKTEAKRDHMAQIQVCPRLRLKARVFATDYFAHLSRTACLSFQAAELTVVGTESSSNFTKIATSV